MLYSKRKHSLLSRQDERRRCEALNAHPSAPALSRDLGYMERDIQYMENGGRRIKRRAR